VDYGSLLVNRAELDRLARGLARVDLAAMPDDEARIAFWINAYNLLAVRSVVNSYPVASPRDVPGFFDRTRHGVAGDQVTLDDIEKRKLPSLGADARFHLALVCGARSCPPLRGSAYPATGLDAALDEQARAALAEPDQVEVTGEAILLSRIFEWHADDFNAAGGAVAFVNAHRETPVPTDLPVRYQDWDWRLNLPGTSRAPALPVPVPIPGGPTGDLPAPPPVGPRGTELPDEEYAGEPRPDLPERDLRDYTPSTLLLPGEAEVQTFHNLYTQTEYFDDQGERQDAGGRATYYTGVFSVTWGWKRNVNPGVDLVLRHVNDGTFPEASATRTGITAVEPHLEFIPLPEFPNVALRTGIRFPVGSDLEGNGTSPFLDWDDLLWNNRLSTDWNFTPDFYIYLEAGARVRYDSAADDVQVTMPTKFLPTFHVSDRWSGYVTFEYESDFVGDAAGNYFTQVGAGAKYRPRPWVELETLFTTFPFGVNSGAGRTMNLGVRILR
jgi:hypothetical protein